jgi:hypothetical protein
MQVKEEDARAILFDIKRGRKTYMACFLQVTDAFLVHYGKSDHAIRTHQYHQRFIVKGAAEPIREYFQRWEGDFNMALPGGTDRAGSITTSEKATMFVHSLERDVQQDYHYECRPPLASLSRLGESEPVVQYAV